MDSVESDTVDSWNIIMKLMRNFRGIKSVVKQEQSASPSLLSQGTVTLIIIIIVLLVNTESKNSLELYSLPVVGIIFSFFYVHWP